MADPNRTKRQSVALKLGDMDLTTLNKAPDPVPNKGNYLMWRKYLLVQKAIKGTLIAQVFYTHLIDG